MNGMKLNPCNIYDPNVEDTHFFHKMNKLLGGIVNDEGRGDFNQIQDNVLNRTTYSKIIPKERQAIHLLMKDQKVVHILLS